MEFDWAQKAAANKPQAASNSFVAITAGGFTRPHYASNFFTHEILTCYNIRLRSADAELRPTDEGGTGDANGTAKAGRFQKLSGSSPTEPKVFKANMVRFAGLWALRQGVPCKG
jgi:hypothetical protein